jgi:hypothetical protein
MLIAEIRSAIRRGIREPSTRVVTNPDILAVVLRGVTVLGIKIKEVDSSFFNARKAVQSTTHIFTKPSDFILKVWDLGTTAKTITGAVTSGGSVKLTSAAHGFSEDDIVFVQDVGGTTEADGTWILGTTTTNTTILTGSTFANTYTSGGIFYKIPTNPDEITKIEVTEATNSHTNLWYPRGGDIVIDDIGFTNDILVDYIDMPDAIADIPASYHEWLISFGIIDLMVIPKRGTVDYNLKIERLNLHTQRMARIEEDIKRSLKASTEPTYIRDDFFRVPKLGSDPWS